MPGLPVGDSGEGDGGSRLVSSRGSAQRLPYCLRQVSKRFPPNRDVHLSMYPASQMSAKAVYFGVAFRA